MSTHDWQIKTLVSALQNWGRHHPWCAYVQRTGTASSALPSSLQCDCGLTATINAALEGDKEIGAGFETITAAQSRETPPRGKISMFQSAGDELDEPTPQPVRETPAAREPQPIAWGLCANDGQVCNVYTHEPRAHSDCEYCNTSDHRPDCIPLRPYFVRPLVFADSPQPSRAQIIEYCAKVAEDVATWPSRDDQSAWVQTVAKRIRSLSDSPSPSPMPHAKWIENNAPQGLTIDCTDDGQIRVTRGTRDDGDAFGLGLGDTLHDAIDSIRRADRQEGQNV